MAIVFAAMVPHPPLIIPQVGRGEEQLIEKTAEAFRSVMLAAAAAQPETVVIISPHAADAGDYFHISPRSGAAGDLSAFNAASVKANVSYDEEFVRQLCQLAAAEDFPSGFLADDFDDFGSFVSANAQPVASSSANALGGFADFSAAPTTAAPANSSSGLDGKKGTSQ